MHHLTEDLQVFVVVGFVLDDTPLCYVDLHDTPVIGGVITQERLDRASAPWFRTSWAPRARRPG